ncbi:MAG: hypothetical protein K8I30_04405 [Anaerolineae bacterium]|nr:hypothetical protein [Anaerolineae bacterium]
MKTLFRVLTVVVVLAALQAGVYKKGSFDITELTKPAAEVEFQKKGSFDITEFAPETEAYKKGFLRHHRIRV